MLRYDAALVLVTVALSTTASAEPGTPVMVTFREVPGPQGVETPPRPVRESSTRVGATGVSTSPFAGVVSSQYPTTSRITCVVPSWLYREIWPPAPIFTFTRLGRVSPPDQLRLDALGREEPAGHTVRYE